MKDIKPIQKDCLKGRLEMIETTNQIDEAIGGITRVDYKHGKKFKVTNHNEMYSLDVIGMSKKQEEINNGLAVALYFRAGKNGSIHPGEVHISKYASTKHHMDGIYKIKNKHYV